MNLKPVVFVVDDDSSVCKSIERLIRSAGLDVETFTSAHEFLASNPADRPGCLVLDVQMPEINGLELQEKLAALHCFIPIIFVSGYGNVPVSVQAMKAGAVDFLEKPYDGDTLLYIINRAIKKDIERRQGNNELATEKKRIEALTPREREVFKLVVTGMLNKQIAYQLGITEKTIKVHRARIMQKTGAKSLADLVRLAERLK